MNKAKASAIKKPATKGNNKNGGDYGQLKKQNIRWRPKRTRKIPKITKKNELNDYLVY
jgi:hypothetical protein